MSKKFDIPGGKVTFTEPKDFTTRQARAIALAVRKIRREAIDADEITIEGQEVPEDAADVKTDVAGFRVDLSNDDVQAFWGYGDTLIVTLVESWTLRKPTPKTIDELLDLPADLYNALHAAVSEVQAEHPDLGASEKEFGPDGAPDRTSPTGA